MHLHPLLKNALDEKALEAVIFIKEYCSVTSMCCNCPFYNPMANRCGLTTSTPADYEVLKFNKVKR